MYVECALEKKTRTRWVCLFLKQQVNFKWVFQCSDFKEKVL